MTRGSGHFHTRVAESHSYAHSRPLIGRESRCCCRLTRTLLAAFEKYQAKTKPIDLVANLGFGELSDKEASEFPRVCARLIAERIDAGLTMDDVLKLLRESGLDSYRRKFPQQVTLQLISRDHELRGDRFVYRGYRTLGS
jgi:hypothetical protein